jgi:hypothetical protein
MCWVILLFFKFGWTHYIYIYIFYLGVCWKFFLDINNWWLYLMFMKKYFIKRKNTEQFPLLIIGLLECKHLELQFSHKHNKGAIIIFKFPKFWNPWKYIIFFYFWCFKLLEILAFKNKIKIITKCGKGIYTILLYFVFVFNLLI